MNQDMMDRSTEIAGNLREVQEKIKAACERVGRDPAEIKLIAVSKKKPFSDIQAAWTAGATEFGENYVQELMGKIQASQEMDPGEMGPLRWHMIGHLQKNKVKYLVGNVALIHSVDSLALAEQIGKEAARKNVFADVLMEVNVAEEESKWGFPTEDALSAARELSRLPHVRLRGLMTSAPYTEVPESNRGYFRTLRELSTSMRTEGLIQEGDSLYRTPVLSMGMSGDYEIAVEEGATMVRVGTSIFGERVYS